MVDEEDDNEFVRKIYLTEEGSRRFAEAVLNPKEPNEALKELVRISREKYPNLWQTTTN